MENVGVKHVVRTLMGVLFVYILKISQSAKYRCYYIAENMGVVGANFTSSIQTSYGRKLTNILKK